MWFSKPKKETVKEVSESSIICSSCYVKMMESRVSYDTSTNRIIANVCPKCNGILIDKKDLEKSIIYFINNEKKFL